MMNCNLILAWLMTAAMATAAAAAAAPTSTSKTVDVPVTASTQVPSSASRVVNRSFLGLGVECISWPQFAGDDETPNKFSSALIGNLARMTGADVLIRVGGTSQDTTVYNASQSVAIKTIGPDHGLATMRSLGPKWLQAFTQIPLTRYILEVPMATGTIATTVDFAKAAYGVLKASRLSAIEIGNEPNFYPGTDRPRNWGPQQYSAEFQDYQTAIAGNLSLGSAAVFQAGAIGSGAGATWDAPQVYQSGLNGDKSIASFSMHYYQTTVGVSLTKTLLNHTDTVSRTEGLFRTSINYVDQNEPQTEFVLGEIGSSLAFPGYKGPVYDRSLAAALWLVDFSLYAMSIGVVKISVQQGTDFNFAAWRPVQTPAGPAAVLGQYYGLAALATWLESSAAPLRVTSLWNEAHPNVSPYAGYVDGKLARYMVVNLNYYNATTAQAEPARETRNAALSIPSGVAQIRIRRLTGPGSEAAAPDISWAGTQYTAEQPQGHNIGPSSESAKVVDGKAIVTIQASEAVLVDWD